MALEALATGTPVVTSDNPGGVELGEIFGYDVSVVPEGEPAGAGACDRRSARRQAPRSRLDAAHHRAGLSSARGAAPVHRHLPDGHRSRRRRACGVIRRVVAAWPVRCGGRHRQRGNRVLQRSGADDRHRSGTAERSPGGSTRPSAPETCRSPGPRRGPTCSVPGIDRTSEWTCALRFRGGARSDTPATARAGRSRRRGPGTGEPAPTSTRISQSPFRGERKTGCC